MNVLVFLFVGLIAGFLASKVLTGKGLGILADIVVGIIGSFIGAWLASLVGISIGGFFGQVVVAFAGAIILLLILHMVTGRRTAKT
jgi:uncharacterized membrane protein YeaQ/YmgE (transglycosylase-associated protein family)